MCSCFLTFSSHTYILCFVRSTPLYPTASNSYNPSNGQVTPYEHYRQKPQQQQTQSTMYKTTIPVNEHCQRQQQQVATTANSCHCSSGSDSGAFVQSAVGGTQLINNNTRNDDAMHGKQLAIGIPMSTQHCCHATDNRNTFASTQAQYAHHSSSQANNNHTTTLTTTTTTVEYELSNGIAKLSKISTSRVAAEQSLLPCHLLQTQQTISFKKEQEVNSLTENTANRINKVNALEKEKEQQHLLPPLLSSKALQELSDSIEALNSYNSSNRNLLTSVPKQQLRNYSTMAEPVQPSKCFSQKTNLAQIDDAEVPGKVSGLERLHQKKYNKVSDK